MFEKSVAMNGIDVGAEVRGEVCGMAARFHHEIRGIRFPGDFDAAKISIEFSRRREFSRNAFIHAEVGLIESITPRNWRVFRFTLAPHAKVPFGSDFAGRVGIVNFHPVGERPRPTHILQ